MVQYPPHVVRAGLRPARLLPLSLVAAALAANLLLCAHIAEACGSPATPFEPPPLNELLDKSLRERTLSPDKRASLESLRRRIQGALDQQDLALARTLEETAMAQLDYRKVWLRCGPGVFVWRPMAQR